MPKTVYFLFIPACIFFASCKEECACYDSNLTTKVTKRFPTNKGFKEECEAIDKKLEASGGYCIYYK